jgi:hypothetical protein
VRDLMTGLDWKSANAPTVIHPCLEGNGSFAKTASAGQTIGKGVSEKRRPYFFARRGRQKNQRETFNPLNRSNSARAVAMT